VNSARETPEESIEKIWNAVENLGLLSKLAVPAHEQAVYSTVKACFRAMK
jgi:hypothetical protein